MTNCIIPIISQVERQQEVTPLLSAVAVLALSYLLQR